jgi:Rad3-related DNA helicase
LDQPPIGASRPGNCYQSVLRHLREAEVYRQVAVWLLRFPVLQSPLPQGEQLKPTDLGLPPKFAEFRAYPGFDQLATARDLATATERLQILNSATGSGKSVTYSATAALRDARWLVLVGTRGLQTQLLDDGLVKRLVWGHRNYSCAAGMGGNAEDADTDDPEYRCCVPRDRCYYLADVAAAQAARSVVCNYAYWMSIARYSDPDLLGPFDFLVCDEAHGAHSWLTKAVSVYLSPGRVGRTLGVSRWPHLPVWPEIGKWHDVFAHFTRLGYERLAGLGREDRIERRKVERLIRDLELLATVSDPDAAEAAGYREPWIVIPGQEHDRYVSGSVQFSPRYPSDFAERLLFRGIPNVLLTSATVAETHADWLGIPPAERRYREVPSPFDPRRRPVIWVPTARVDFRMSDGARWKLGQRVDELIAAAIDQDAGNGLLHTGSYERTREIVGGSKFRAAIITHRQPSRRDPGDFAEALGRFKEAGRRGQFAVFASPRAQEGISLDDELGRWQALLKMPFPDGRDPLTAARAKSASYRNAVVTEAVTQMIGRLVRSMGDYGTTWILDDHWSHIRQDCPFAAWLRAAFQVVRVDNGERLKFLTHEIVAGLPAPRVVELIGA